MSVLAVDQLTSGLERKHPSFFSLLSVLWAMSVTVVSLAVLFTSAEVSASRIDAEKQALADETMSLIEVFARGMNRHRPQDFVLDVIATGHFERFGVYCTKHAATFEGRPEHGVLRSETTPELARQTFQTQSSITEVTPTEIMMSRPLFTSSGLCDGAIYMSVARVDRDALLTQLTREMMPAVLLVLATGLLICTALAHRMTAPLRHLNTVSDRIAAGDLDMHIRSEGPAEFRALAGSVSSMVGALRSNMERIQKLSFVDSVTDLPNRAAFRELGEKAVTQSRAGSGTMIAVLYIDLDGFHNVNEVHGDDVGDAALRHFAGLLTETLRETDEIIGGVGPDAHRAHSTPARVGEDAFTVLLTGLEQAVDAEIVAQRVLHLFGRAFEVSGIALQLGASIGVAYGDPRETDVLDLLAKAHNAMQDVKDAGKNSYEVYAAPVSGGSKPADEIGSS